MDTSFIIYIILFLVVVFLIFKFIKKLVFAVFAVIVLVVLIIGGIGGLIYSDINNLTSQEDYNVKIIYAQSSEDYLFGVSLPIENQSLGVDKVVSLSDAQLNTLDVDTIDDKSNEFVIIVDDSRFEMLVVEESYDLNSLGDFDFSSYKDYNLVLSKQDVLDIVNSDNGEEMLVDILFKNNNLEGTEAKIAKPALLNAVKSSLSEVNLSFREALFLLIVSNSMENSQGLVNIVEGYKEGDIEVYPNRISFRFLKLLPASTIKSFFSDNETEIEK